MKIPSDRIWTAWSLRPVPVEYPDFEMELCERLELERKLESLPPDLHEHGQMLLARLNGANPTEIAGLFGVSRGCVLYRLRRVLAELGVKNFSDF